MNTKNFILTIAGAFLFLQASAQKYDENERYLLSASSPKGNYVYLFRNNSDTGVFQQSGRFIVERMISEKPKNGKTEGLKHEKIGEVAPVRSLRELHRYYSSEEIQQLYQYFDLTSEEALLEKIQNQHNPSSYEITYADIRMQQAVGHVFLDETAEVGKTYLYRVLRKEENGSLTLWGNALQNTRMQNEGLQQYRAVQDSMIVSDSLVLFQWSYDLAQKEIPGRKPSPEDISNNDEYLINPKNLSLRTYVLRNGKLADSKSYLGIANQKEHKVEVTHSVRTLPEDEIMAYTVLEDEVGNQSAPSDTAYIVALSYNKAPIVLSADVREVTDGLRISWPLLPAKRYISGVKIQRLGGDGNADIATDITMAAPTDTTFTDYTAKAGFSYRYLVTTAFAKGIAFQQRVPAIAVGQLAKFSKPVPPRNLRIATSGQNIRIDWDSSISKGFFGYHVYRSFDGGAMELVAGPVKTNSFTDTAHHLSGRTIYSYAVQTQNLMQDTSVLSDTVSITPERPVVMNGPVTVTAYYANRQVQLSWDDARKNDNYITGYQVERSVDKGAFTPFGGMVDRPFAVDSSIQPGAVYQYRVAAVGPKGERSEYTNEALFTLPKSVPQTTLDAITRSTEQGIEVRWNGLMVEDQKDFAVYRRVLPDNNYRFIGSVAPGTFEFVDKDTKEGENYMYVVTFRYKNGTEGPQGLPRNQVFHRLAAAQ